MIVWRPDKPASDFEVPDSAYPAVFPYPKKGSCAATLFDRTHAITAAHCFDGQGAHNAEAPFDVTIAGETYTVSKVLRIKCHTTNGHDSSRISLSPKAWGDKSLYVLWNGPQNSVGTRL